MNNKQREFLIDKVKQNKGKLLREIEAAMPKAPDMNQYIILAVMSDTFELKSLEHMRKALREKAAQCARKGKSFIDSDYDYQDGERIYSYRIKLDVHEFMELPEDFRKEYKIYEEAKKVAQVQRESVERKSDTLITRITLASAPMLVQIIEEVDGMGSLSINDMVVQKLGPKEVRLALKALDMDDQKLLG